MAPIDCPALDTYPPATIFMASRRATSTWIANVDPVEPVALCGVAIVVSTPSTSPRALTSGPHQRRA